MGAMRLQYVVHNMKGFENYLGIEGVSKVKIYN